MTVLVSFDPKTGVLNRYSKPDFMRCQKAIKTHHVAISPLEMARLEQADIAAFIRRPHDDFAVKPKGELKPQPLGVA